MSLTLDPKKLAGEPEDELSQLRHELGKIAAVSHRKGLAILSLICNVEKTSEILMRVGAGRGAERSCPCGEREGCEGQEGSRGCAGAGRGLGWGACSGGGWGVGLSCASCYCWSCLVTVA